MTRPAFAALLAVLAACGARSGLMLATEPDGPPSRADRARPIVDAGPDRAILVDRRLRDASMEPCATPRARVAQTIDALMVVCHTDGAWTDQCGAPQLCGPSWHLCTAAEYQARFGAAAAAPQTETTWIGACILTGGSPHAPTSQACAQCPKQSAVSFTVGWGCSKDTAAAVQSPFGGVTSHPECYRVGINSPSTAAYWAPSRSDYLLRQSFCCR